MNRLFFPVFSSLFLAACVTSPAMTPTAAPQGEYTLDPEHTSVLFSLSHAGLSNFTGRFDEISGTLDFEPDAPEDSRLFIHIKAASVNTGLPAFDRELAGDSKYFDADTYPDIFFRSAGIEITGENRGRVTGNLSLKGVTRPVILEVTFNGAGKSFGHPGKTLGFSATGSLDRSDFNMGYLTNFGIGDEVSLRIETEFNESQD